VRSKRRDVDAKRVAYFSSFHGVSNTILKVQPSVLQSDVFAKDKESS